MSSGHPISLSNVGDMVEIVKIFNEQLIHKNILKSGVVIMIVDKDSKNSMVVAHGEKKYNLDHKILNTIFVKPVKKQIIEFCSSCDHGNCSSCSAFKDLL